MVKLKAWIGAFRLRTLPLSLSVISVGNALAWHGLYTHPHGDVPLDSHEWELGIMGLTLLTTLFLQILSNLANDYGDAVKGTDNENRVGPMRAVQSGAIARGEMRRAIAVLAVLALASGIGLLLLAFGTAANGLFIAFVAAGVGAIAAAITYTVGNYAYGYRALGDVSVFLFFGVLGVGGSAYLQLKGNFSSSVLPIAVAVGAWCVAVLNLNNMRDRVNDQAMGKVTLPVLLGFERAKHYHYALFALSWGALLLFFVRQGEDGLSWAVCVAPLAVLHALHIRRVARIKVPELFDPELKKIALSTLLFSVLIWVYPLYIHLFH